MTIWGSI